MEEEPREKPELCALVSVAGTNFRIIHMNPLSTHIEVEADFGIVPYADPHEALLQLLEMNALFIRGEMCGFGIDAQANTIFYREVYNLVDPEHRVLSTELLRIAAHAESWLQRQFS